jgi:phosphoglycerate dehydrogenase-like enzyme
MSETRSEARTLGVNAVSNQPFWQVPERFVRALEARLPGWEIVVARAASEIGPMVKRSHVVVGWPFPAVMARGAKGLTRVHFFTSGVPESWGVGGAVRVTSAKGANAGSVAEHGLFLALAALRGLRRASLASWDPEAFAVPRAAGALSALIAGYGAIGRRVARLVAPLFRDVRVTARTRPDAMPDGIAFHDVSGWDELVRAADVVFLTLPLTPESRALFGPRFFGALKDDAIVVNLARGELVDEDALLAFLARSPRSRYATDVTIPEPYPPDGKLGASDQIVITPHVGARREDAWQAIEASTLAIFDEEDRP